MKSTITLVPSSKTPQFTSPTILNLSTQKTESSGHSIYGSISSMGADSQETAEIFNNFTLKQVKNIEKQLLNGCKALRFKNFILKTQNAGK